MAGIRKYFSPSVNIERDENKEFDYVVTSNSKQIYDQLINGRESGIHSYTIIGSYGTGKSSFLLALRKNLLNEVNYFKPLNGEFSDVKDFEFDFVVGKYGSLIERLIKYFELENNTSEDALLTWIEKKHKKFKKSGKFWFLVIDEFGKHLEYAAKENPEKELYFIQQLSEFANENEKNFYLITTLHQAFDSYANGLNTQQQKEWNKVRGRLKELTFNEPVEQLLHIALEYLEAGEKEYEEKNLKHLTSAIEESHAFPLRNDLSVNLAQKLFPLDPLAAGVLALSLQKYGQNERSLFTFLQSGEYLGIHDYDDVKNPFFNLTCVYDYLSYNYYHVLSSKHNPHYVQWNSMKRSLERVESVIKEDTSDAKKIIKTVGLLNIFASKGAKIDIEFLKSYTALACGIKNPKKLIAKLEEKKIIRFRSFNNQYILFEGTDLDLAHELQNVTNKVDPIPDVVTYLDKYFEFPFLPAKRVYYEKGTPRFFEFKLSEKLIQESPEQPIDGVINFVFNNSIKEVIEISKKGEGAILYAVFKNTQEIEQQLFEIEKVKFLIGKIGQDDKVAVEELKQFSSSLIDELSDIVLSNIYDGKGNINWVYKGKTVPINDRKSLNNELSNICDTIYSKTPIFQNELINKESVSPAIYRPRKELLKLLIEQSDQENLGFDDSSFPAEKTIYLSFLKQHGFHRETENGWELGTPDKNSGFTELWKASEEFFESTKSGKRELTEFISQLKKPPFGLKSGLIELWIPVYLIIKKDNFALFKEEAYVTELTYEMVSLVYRNPKLFEIKAFHISDIKRKVFSKYRALHNQDEETEFSNESFVETVRPFLLIYNELNEYGRTTNTISKPAQQLRGAIKSATDPEKAFFSDFISALGFSTIEDLNSDHTIKQFVYDLDKSIDEIKNAYNQLLNRIESCILETFELKEKSYEEYLPLIQSRYENLKSFRLAPYQKKLHGRIQSKQPGRGEWLSAVAFAVLDKPLSNLEDSEEPLLMERLTNRIEELDNLRDLAHANVKPERDQAYSFKLQPLGKKTIAQNIIVEKKKLEKEEKRMAEIRSLLTTNKKLNKAILVKLLEELGENNE